MGYSRSEGCEVDDLTPEKRSWNMSRIRGSNTRPELLVRSLLHRIGYRFRLHRRDLPGTPDVVLPKYKTVVFVHGCFWHRHPGCRFAYTPKSRVKFWTDKFSANVNRDARARHALEQAGWTVLVVWECELKDMKVLAKRLAAEIGGEGT